MEVEPHHNVKAAKGVAMRHLPATQKNQVGFKSLTVTLNGEPLKDKDKLVDLNCGKTPLIISYGI